MTVENEIAQQEENRATKTWKKVLRNCAIALGVVVAAIVLVVCIAGARLSGAVSNVEQLDENGLLYYVEYTADYYNDPLVKIAPDLIRGVSCTAFATSNSLGDVLTCRNYDVYHKSTDGDLSGLNVVLRCNPEGKYASINMADAAWLSVFGLSYYAGALDNGPITKIPLALLPYLCMDGLNEKGLSVSILSIDVKEGDPDVCNYVEGRRDVSAPELLRLSLDECATVDEAIALAQGVNMKRQIGVDFHMFVTDDTGASVVLEWRYGDLHVTRTDAVTNFYVAYDDAQDSYAFGKLKERWVAPEKNDGGYHYGFGCGYGRFTTVAQALDAHRVGSATAEDASSDKVAADESHPEWNAYSTRMEEDEQIALLSEARQTYYPGSLGSYTQYSAIYNNTEKTLAVRVMPSFDTCYSFAL